MFRTPEIFEREAGMTLSAQARSNIIAQTQLCSFVSRLTNKGNCRVWLQKEWRMQIWHMTKRRCSGRVQQETQWVLLTDQFASVHYSPLFFHSFTCLNVFNLLTSQKDLAILINQFLSQLLPGLTLFFFFFVKWKFSFKKISWRVLQVTEQGKILSW